MCEQCQAFDDDDEDALAAAFVARHGKPASAPRETHAVLNLRAGPKPALPVKKER